MQQTTQYVNSIFEQPFWLDIVAKGQWGEVFTKAGNNVIARMPYVIHGDKIVMPPLTQTLGPWIAPECREFQRGNAQLRKQKEIIAELLSQLPAHKSFSMTFDSSNSYILPYRWHDFSFTPAFSYRIEDLTDTNRVYANFSKTVVKNIKTARHKVEIIESVDSGKMLHLLDLTFQSQDRKNPMNQKLVKKIIDTAIEHHFGKLLLSVDERQNIHSGAFLLYDKNVCYYLFGGTNPEFKSGGAQSLVLWTAIQFAATVSEKFDFEGSMVEGIETFFNQFGGRQVINYHVTKNSLAADIFSVLKPRIKKILGYKN